MMSMNGWSVKALVVELAKWSKVKHYYLINWSFNKSGCLYMYIYVAIHTIPFSAINHMINIQIGHHLKWLKKSKSFLIIFIHACDMSRFVRETHAFWNDLMTSLAGNGFSRLSSFHVQNFVQWNIDVFSYCSSFNWIKIINSLLITWMWSHKCLTFITL